METELRKAKLGVIIPSVSWEFLDGVISLLSPRMIMILEDW